MAIKLYIILVYFHVLVKVLELYEIDDSKFIFHIACNDYIVLISKTNQEEVKVLNNLTTSHFQITPHTYNTFFMPIIIYDRTYYLRQAVENNLQLNNKLVLSSFNITVLSNDDLRKAVRHMITIDDISKLFDHMKDFIHTQKISKYKAGYDELVKDINDISNQIIAYIRDKYPEVRPNEHLLNRINSQLSWALSQSIENIRTKIIDNCYALFQSPIIVRLHELEIKLPKLISYKMYYDKKELYDKKTKKFLINVAILSFIKVMPNNLWQLCNEDALSILVKPKVKFMVIHQSEYNDFVNSLPEHKKSTFIFLEPFYFLVITFDYALVNKVDPIKISINISSLSLFLKSKSVKNFWVALNEVINEVYEKTIYSLSGLIYLYSTIAI